MPQTAQHRLSRAIAITDAAAAVSLAHFRQPVTVEEKPDRSPVTIADRETEAAIRAQLEAEFPGAAIFGEEFGTSGAGRDMWIVDPIDGTRSFLTGLPLFGMLLGHLKDQRPEVGVIRMPALGEVYAGGPGLGATMNGAPIATSDVKSLDRARLFINEGDKIAAREPMVFARMIRTAALRRMGADCYPHALVAAGRADAVVDFDLEPYDYLPVAAVVQAAGGIMTDWSGAPLTMASDGRTITAATPQLHAELLSLLAA